MNSAAIFSSVGDLIVGSGPTAGFVWTLGSALKVHTEVIKSLLLKEFLTDCTVSDS